MHSTAAPGVHRSCNSEKEPNSVLQVPRYLESMELNELASIVAGYGLVIIMLPGGGILLPNNNKMNKVPGKEEKNMHSRYPAGPTINSVAANGAYRPSRVNIVLETYPAFRVARFPP